MTPTGARLIAGALVLVTGGVVTNVTYLQDSAAARGAIRGKPSATTSFAALTSSPAPTVAQRTSPIRLASLSLEVPAVREPEPSMPTRIEVARLGGWTTQAAAVQAAVNRRAEARIAMIREIQRELTKRGYEPGATDGEAGLVTKAAIVAFEHDQGLPETGEPNPYVHQWLLNPRKAQASGPAPADAARTRNASGVARSIRQMLAGRGYLPARPEAQEAKALSAAILKFEMEHGLVPSGRISGPLAAALLRARSAPAGRVAASR